MRAWFERLSMPERIGLGVLVGAAFGLLLLVLSKKTAASTTATTGAAANNLGTVTPYDPAQSVDEGAVPQVPQTINVTVQPTPVPTPTPQPPAPGTGAGSGPGIPVPPGTAPPGVTPTPPAPPEYHPPVAEPPPVSPDPVGVYQPNPNPVTYPYYYVRAQNWVPVNLFGAAERQNPVIDPVSALTYHPVVRPQA